MIKSKTDKIKKCEEVRRSIIENGTFGVFDLVRTEDEKYLVERVDLLKPLGEQRVFDEHSKFPTRVSRGILEIMTNDKSFIPELIEVYKRFLRDDWGDLPPDDLADVSITNRNRGIATGYYQTSYGEIEIKRDYILTTAYLPFEK